MERVPDCSCVSFGIHEDNFGELIISLSCEVRGHQADTASVFTLSAVLTAQIVLSFAGVAVKDCLAPLPSNQDLSFHNLVA